MKTTSNFYKKIYDLRQKTKMTQEKLAEKVGLSRGTITSIEQGKRKITIEELLKFCNAFNCSCEDFLSSGREKKSMVKDSKKNVHELYGEYKKKYQGKMLPCVKGDSPIDDYLRKVNPYYYPSTNNEIKYER